MQWYTGVERTLNELWFMTHETWHIYIIISYRLITSYKTIKRKMHGCRKLKIWRNVKIFSLVLFSCENRSFMSFSLLHTPTDTYLFSTEMEPIHIELMDIVHYFQDLNRKRDRAKKLLCSYRLMARMNDDMRICVMEFLRESIESWLWFSCLYTLDTSKTVSELNIHVFNTVKAVHLPTVSSCSYARHSIFFSLSISVCIWIYWSVHYIFFLCDKSRSEWIFFFFSKKKTHEEIYMLCKNVKYASMK